MSAVVSHELSDRVRAAGPFDAEACMNCGVCTAVCPLGLEDRVLAETETIYSCLLCRACQESCPAGVHIADNVRTLRHHLNRTAFGL